MHNMTATLTVQPPGTSFFRLQGCPWRGWRPGPSKQVIRKAEGGPCAGAGAATPCSTKERVMDVPDTVLPGIFRPMLPTLVERPFDSPDHLFEVKWDGVRMLGFCEASGTRLYSRSGREITHRYPELGELHKRLNVSSAVLDGEIVALDSRARPSFELLQRRINLSRASDIARGMVSVPVDLVLFDVPFCSGEWLGGQPLIARTRRLDQAVSFGGRVLRSEPVPQHGIALFEAAVARGLEGVVAKAEQSHYLPDRRTRDWLKVKSIHEIDCVIGGFSAGSGSRADSLGALLLGAYRSTALRYMGSVGTGFDGRSLTALLLLLKGLETAQSPFSQVVPSKAAVHWTRPVLVCKVEYRELTSACRLRAPSFKGLRDDKAPQECLLPEVC